MDGVSIYAFLKKIVGAAPPEQSAVPAILEQSVEPAPAVFDESAEPKILETKRGIGTVTVLENGMMKGVVNGKYYFSKERFEDLIVSGLVRGKKVDYEAQLEKDSIVWEVTSMKFHLSPEELEKEDKRRFKTIVGSIVHFHEDDKVALVRYGKSQDEVQEVPFGALPKDYDVIRGDFLRIELEASTSDINGENVAGRIRSVEPTKKKTILGKVTRNHRGQFSVENHIYFEQAVCKGRCPNPHDSVRVVAVESKYDSSFNWRAVSVQLSNFPHHSSGDKKSSAGSGTGTEPAPGAWQNRNSEDTISHVIEDRSKTTVRAAAPFIRQPFFQSRQLEQNLVPKVLWTIVQKADDELLIEKFPSVGKELKIETYQQKFEVALWLEEIQNDILRRQHDVKNIILEKSGEYLKFEVLGLRDIHPPIQIGDPVTVHDHTDLKRKFTTNVYDIRGLHIFIKFDNRDRNSYNNLVTIQFNLSRTTYRRAHHAIDLADKYLGEGWLFPTENVVVKPPRLSFFEKDDSEDNEIENGGVDDRREEQDIESRLVTLFPKPQKLSNRGSVQTKEFGSGRTTNHRMRSIFNNAFVSDTKAPTESEAFHLKWFNSSLNREQKDAVRRILRGQGRPLPYIIYGPPGTGKTVTVVEALIQLYKLDPDSRVLVTAPSNSAADVIAEHLVRSNQFRPGDFVRLVGFLRQDIQIPESIRDYCVDGEYLEAVARHKLIVCTCTTAGQFVTLGIDTSGHFTHVFIDEAGYCTEPEAIIPAILCALSKEGQVILAGDPKQLGPVLMSDVAGNCGLSLSLLERLMSLPLYSRNVEKFPEEKYNPFVLTKLVKNYRAHPILLTLPSQLFYDNELESAVLEKDVDLCHSLEFLGKSKGVPLLFHGVQGICEREIDSPSWFNKAEIIQVLHYVRDLRNFGLTNDDIGIITPYRKQVEKLRRALALGLLEDDVPRVGSVEEFQGGERKVMIMSLVRSVAQNRTDKVIDRMSFIFSAKRFNVAITRAKALLIVVGNPHVMAHDRNWHTFLRYCIDLDCYVGCDLPIHLNQLAQKYLERFDNPDENNTTGDPANNHKFFDVANYTSDFPDDEKEVEDDWC